MAVIIVDYGAGNLRSVQRALAELGTAAEISADPAVVRTAGRVIFPGVGAAGSAMRNLRRTGLEAALRDVSGAGTPLLGICLGLQISLHHSEEDDTDTLGMLAGQVRRFALNDPALKVPHMGWNAVDVVQPHPVLAAIEPGDEFYFVHAYYPEPAEVGCVVAESSYERTFACALARDNFLGTQFHPEKSGRPGLELLQRFLHWDGRWDGAGGSACCQSG